MHVRKHLTITTLLCASIFGSADALAVSEPTSELGPRIGAAAKAKKLPLRENMQKNYHYEAWKVGDRFVHWRLVRNKDGQVMHKAYPYDKPALNGAGEMKRYGFNQFNALLKARLRIKAPKAPLVIESPKTLNPRIQSRASGITYQTGLPLGANPSTGLIPTSANCFNSTTTLDNGISQLSFSSTGSASSIAGQTNISASISGSISVASGSVTANDVFTYGNNYATSQTSGNFFFTAYQIYTANNTFYSLSQAGLNAQTTNEFSTDCGSVFVSSVPVGMLITGQASYSASTVAAATSIANSFTGSASGSVGSLANFSAAVSSAYSNSSQNTGSSYTFWYTTTVIGGGEGAQAIFTNAMATNAVPYLASCSSGTISACDSFVTSANAAATTALTVFENCFETTPANQSGSNGCPSSTATDVNGGNYSGMATFPNGVAGVQTTKIVDNQSLSALIAADSAPQYTDLMSSYTAQLKNYLNIYNQIATLYNRAMYLGNNNINYIIGKINKSNSYDGYSQTFNPTPIIDISGSYFSPLLDQYGGDLNLIINNLTSCTGASSANVSTACQPIVQAYNQGVTSAYGWYGTTLNGNSVSNNNFALQNTIALQYSGTATNSGGTFPLDVVWVQALPTATLGETANSLPSGTTNPAGLPGLIAFADQPYTWNVSPTPGPNYNSPFLQLFPLSPGSNATISTPTSSYLPYNYYISYYGSLGTLGWQLNTGGPSSLSYGNGASSIGFNNLPSISAVGSSYVTPPGTVTYSEVLCYPKDNTPSNGYLCTVYFTPLSGSYNYTATVNFFPYDPPGPPVGPPVFTCSGTSSTSPIWVYCSYQSTQIEYEGSITAAAGSSGFSGSSITNLSATANFFGVQ